MTNNEILKKLTPEQIELAKGCKNNAELLKLAKKQGIELTDEQLASVTGGACDRLAKDKAVCPHCNIVVNGKYFDNSVDTGWEYHCRQCGYLWRDTD